MLNAPRLQLQDAAAALLGFSHALSDSGLDEAWFDALAEHPEEIEDMRHTANMKRAIARALRISRER